MDLGDNPDAKKGGDQSGEDTAENDHHEVRYWRAGCPCGRIGTEKEHEEDDTGSVVQHGFSVDQCREALACPQLFQKGDDGYGVSRADQGSEHEGEAPVPVCLDGQDIKYAHDERRCQEHRDDNAWYG